MRDTIARKGGQVNLYKQIDYAHFLPNLDLLTTKKGKVEKTQFSGVVKKVPTFKLLYNTQNHFIGNQPQ